jgi:hypothetical protein
MLAHKTLLIPLVERPHCKSVSRLQRHEKERKLLQDPLALHIESVSSNQPVRASIIRWFDAHLTRVNIPKLSRGEADGQISLLLYETPILSPDTKRLNGCLQITVYRVFASPRSRRSPRTLPGPRARTCASPFGPSRFAKFIGHELPPDGLLAGGRGTALST